MSSEDSPEHQATTRRSVVTYTAGVGRAARIRPVIGRHATSSTQVSTGTVHATSTGAKKATAVPSLYSRMQSIVQQMLHSEYGVPIKSHKRRLISAIPSAFTGADMIQWLMKHLSIDSREAIHIANQFSRHGFFFCVEGLSYQIRDDSTLYRFQTFYFWPSCNPSTTDFDYAVYLVKQVLRSKHRIRLLDYELTNLHKLKLRLARVWRSITEKADDDVRVFREQKRVAKVIIGSQEEAFWRLHRPPPGESSITDSILTRHYTELAEWHPQEMDVKSLEREVAFLKETASRPRVHLSTALDGVVVFCHKYGEFDPMLTVPQPSNPWLSGDDTLWTIEKSYLEYPIERQVRRWACSFGDLLFDVNGRYRFEGFCKSQFCLENVRFWQACRDLKSIPHSSVEESVKLIYEEFLQQGTSKSEVNVSAKVQEEVEKDVKNPTRYAFLAAQNQVFQLMQNDVYPRFIKSHDYKTLVSQSRDSGSGGRGFFSKFKVYSTYAGRRQKSQPLAQDIISPCLPQRFTKRHVSISRSKLGSIASSASLDDLFLATQSPPPKPSAYTEAFIDALIAPTGGVGTRHRRVSAPNSTPPTLSKGLRQTSLVDVFEEEVIKTAPIPPEPGMSLSYSADDMSQLEEDAEQLGKSRWRTTVRTLFKGDAPMSHLHVAANGDAMPTSRSIPFKLSDQKDELLQVPGFALGVSPAVQTAFGTSPKISKKSFEYESIHLKAYSSTESVNSASSVS